MKNENLPAIDQGQHERLCAYVFGELQGAERAFFETELERSPALRRAHEQLTATIGLVQSAVPDEGLSEDVRRDLLASAKRSRFHVVPGRRLLQLAAACVVILGGTYALVLASRPASPFTYTLYGGAEEKVASAPPAEDRVADLERAADAPARKAKDDGLEHLRGLGYGGADDVAADGRAPATPTDAPLSKEVQEALDALGYGRDDESPATEADHFGLAANVPTGAASNVLGEGSVEKSGTDLLFVKKVAGDAATAPALPTAQSEDKSTGGTSIGVGHYGSGQPSAFASRRASSGGKSAVWVAASQGTETRLGLSAPRKDDRDDGTARRQSAPAAAAPPAERSRENQVDAGDRNKLRGLGYVGESGDAQLKDLVSYQDAPTREAVVAQVDELLRASQLAPDESPRDMFFRYFGDAPFVPALEEKTSTFAVDVDTASYALTRAYLNRGELPPRAAVRTEEFVNYFKADQPAPTDGKPFAIGLELAPSLFGGDARAEMLRVTVRGKDVQDFERQPLNLTLVIDNSGSMQEGGRLELVKRALALLLRQLYASDSVAVVKFSNTAALVAPMMRADRRGELEGLIGALPIEGGTNVEAGLRLGYEQALQSLARNTVNRVVLCTDGVGNIGETTAQGLLALVKDARAKGIYLNTVGVGMGNHDDAFLEQLADQGDGVCNYVDSDAEAKRVFVDRLASAVQPIARDVKIQVEFDPTRVESWRLLGYENRSLRTQDFKNDAIDAGEVNAGHQVSALYELVRRSTDGGPLATVRLRYKPPFAIDQGKEGARAEAEAEQALELERTLAGSAVLPGFASATNGYQRAVLVAQFAEVLRRSVHARKDSFGTLLTESRRLAPALGDPDFTEFVVLLEVANPLLDARSKEETPKALTLLDELGRLRYEQALRARKRALATEAREPALSAEAQREVERVEQEAEAAIQRLETEARAELLRARGIEVSPQTPEESQQLEKIGYGK